MSEPLSIDDAREHFSEDSLAMLNNSKFMSELREYLEQAARGEFVNVDDLT